MTNAIIKYNGLDGTPLELLLKDKEYHYKQLAALLNFLKSYEMGKQFVTINSALNTFNKGLSRIF